MVLQPAGPLVLALRLVLPILAVLGIEAQAASPSTRATDSSIVADAAFQFFSTRDPDSREEQARGAITALQEEAERTPDALLSVDVLFRRGITAEEFVSTFAGPAIDTHELVLKVPENDRGQIMTMMVGALDIQALGADTTRNAPRVVACQRARAAEQAKSLLARAPLAPDIQEFADSQARISTSPDLKIYIAGVNGTARALAAALKTGASVVWTVAVDRRRSAQLQAGSMKDEARAMRRRRELAANGCPQPW